MQLLTLGPVQTAALAGAHMQPLLWMRLCQASLGSVLSARGVSLEAPPPQGPAGEAQAQELAFARGCLANARQLAAAPPRPSGSADGASSQW